MREGIVRGWKAIAEALGCSRVTAWRWSVRHGLPVARGPGRRVYVERALLARWALAHGLAGRV